MKQFVKQCSNLDIAVKRSRFMPANRSVPDVKEKRKAWKENMSGYAPEKLVFLDESGININMTRCYARSKGGSRAVDAVPLWKPQNITVLSSIRLNGEAAYGSIPNFV